MKTVRVVAAIIIEKDKVFATQRGYGEFKDGWEFGVEGTLQMKKANRVNDNIGLIMKEIA